MTASTQPLDHTVERMLACPRCHGGLAVTEIEIRCLNGACGFRGFFDDQIAVMTDRAGGSFFDDKHQVMSHGNTSESIRCLCYAAQARFIEPYLKSGRVVLDVGCGPTLAYQRADHCFVIGLDPSLDSLKANSAADLLVYGTATALPVPDQSIDVMMCLYSVHHMVGQTLDENRQVVERAFREFGRAIRPGGDLFICEVTPWLPVWLVEQAAWNTARRVLGGKLDMHFWSAGALTEIGRAALPGARLTKQAFGTSVLTTFPPVFSMPWLKLPRALYPFNVDMFHWEI